MSLEKLRLLKQTLLTNKQIVILFLFTFFIFAFLRFYNLHIRIPFGWDQEHFSTQVRDIIRDQKLTLLGPRVTDDRGFFLAPYFTYLLIPFYLITNLHPQALVIFTIVVNLLFFGFSTYFIGRVFSLKHSLIFLLLWSINPLLIRYDITPWWPIIIPLGVIMVWYILLQIYSHPKNPLYWSGLGMSIGFFCNMHFQFIFIGAFAVAFLCTAFTTKILKYWAGILIAAVSFFVMFSPLLAFDLRHDNLNYTLFKTYFEERVLDDRPYIEAWQPVFANVARSWVGTNSPFITLPFFIGLLVLFTLLSRKKKAFLKTFYIATNLLLLITAFGFSVYGRRPSEYYFTFLFPFILIGFADVLAYTKIKYILPPLILFLILLNMTTIHNTLKDDDTGLYYKDKAVQQILPYKDKKKFNVAYDMPLGLNNGYNYLTDFYGIKNSGDPADPLIQLRMPPQKGDIIVKNFGILIPSELR